MEDGRSIALLPLDLVDANTGQPVAGTEVLIEA